MITSIFKKNSNKINYYNNFKNPKKYQKNFNFALLLSQQVLVKNSTSTATGNLSLKATAVSTSGKTSLTGKATTTSTVVITDFKINIGNIKFETDKDDARHGKDSLHDDVKLVGPFLLDLLDINAPLSQFITAVDIPNAKYDEIRFKFIKSIVARDMNGKSYLIKGIINTIPFVVSSSKEVELKMDFVDPTKNINVSRASTSLNIKIQLDAIMAKLASLANQGLLVTNSNGVIEIGTDLTNVNHVHGEFIKNLLEQESHLDDKD